MVALIAGSFYLFKLTNSPPSLLQAPFTKEQAEKARTEWAAYLKIPERKQLDLPGGVKIDLVLIPPGKFRMGTVGDTTNESAHNVTITKPFYMAETETTQEEYEAVMGKNPSFFQKNVTDRDTSKFPVEKVSWNDAMIFSSQCQERTKAKQVRLPTEAEWEYACRAGTESAYHFGAEITAKNAMFRGSKLERTERVGGYADNGFGLYDMHGNVSEWCLDGYRQDYEKLEPEDPMQNQSNLRVLRGGSWISGPFYCRAASREHNEGSSSNSVGFRVVVLP